MSLTLFGAFVGGVLTLLSPCSVMLLPAFFSYAFTSPGQLLSRTGIFYLGLITTLVPIGVLAGSLGAFVNEHRAQVVAGAAWVVIVLGVLMVAGVSFRLPATRGDIATGTTTSVYALGTVYGLAGVCAGPLLGAVLAFAAFGASPVHGGAVLMVFAAGMTLPLLILALVWDRLPLIRRLVRPRGVRLGRWSNTWTNLVGGCMTISVGVLLLRTEGTTSITGVLSTEQQFRLERWASTWARDVPDIAVAVIAAAVLAAVWLGRRRRGQRRQDGSVSIT